MIHLIDFVENFQKLYDFNKIIQHLMLPLQNPCDYFTMEPVVVGSAQEWRGQMKLKEQLDYEQRSVYEVTIVADVSF